MDSQLFYWERQGKEHTCGIHTVNSILQGPYITKQIFISKAHELKQEQLNISEDLIENHVDEEGCSLELLSKCLSDHKVTFHYIPQKEYEELLNFKGLICNNGDHFFAIINYRKFWINFDSLSEHGPEYLTVEELFELISRQLSDQGTFFQVFGDFPKFYEPVHVLQPYQKIFSLPEIIEGGDLIKVLRISQRPVRRNLSFEEQLRLAYERSLQESEMADGRLAGDFPSEEEQLNIAKALSLDEVNQYEEQDSEDDSSEILELAKKLSVEENLHLFENPVNARVVRENGRASAEEIKENESFEEFENRLKEKFGFSDLEIYLKTKDFDFFPQKNSMVLQEVDRKQPIVLYARCKV